jgi:hypothetical protein
MIFDVAEIETPTCLATSAKATPRVFTNPMAIKAWTLLISLGRLTALPGRFTKFLRSALQSCAFQFLLRLHDERSHGHPTLLYVASHYFCIFFTTWHK